MSRVASNLVEQRNGLVVVVKRIENSPKGEAMWLLKCDCGGEKTCTSAQFKTIFHCGCMSGVNKSNAAKKSYKKGRANTNLKHGMYGTKIHNSWRGMRDRCRNVKHSYYEKYGGKGVTVCDEWLNSFESFRDWALVNGYEEGLSIDRIDNNGNYEPNNCRWSTRIEQANNTTNNRLIELFGSTKNLKQWCECFGFNYDKIRRRLNLGWDKYEAFEIT